MTAIITGTAQGILSCSSADRLFGYWAAFANVDCCLRPTRRVNFVQFPVVAFNNEYTANSSVVSDALSRFEFVAFCSGARRFDVIDSDVAAVFVAQRATERQSC